MRQVYKYLITVFLVVLVSSCDNERGFDLEFLQEQNLCLEVGEDRILSYDPLTCQMSFNRKRKTFRVSNDTMSEYYSLVLDKLPEAEDQEVIGNLTWVYSNAVHERKNLKFTVESINADGKVWLWNQKEKVAVIVQIL